MILFWIPAYERLRQCSIMIMIAWLFVKTVKEHYIAIIEPIPGPLQASA